jgi:hypothetical protein
MTYCDVDRYLDWRSGNKHFFSNVTIISSGKESLHVS